MNSKRNFRKDSRPAQPIKTQVDHDDARVFAHSLENMAWATLELVAVQPIGSKVYDKMKKDARSLAAMAAVYLELEKTRATDGPSADRKIRGEEANELCNLIKHFNHLFPKTELPGGREYRPFKEGKILYVKLPSANSDWTYAIFKAVETFCKNRGSADYWPDFSPSVAKAGYISIRLRF